MSYYGIGDGWCFSCGVFAGQVKLRLLNGTALKQVPPVTPVGWANRPGVWNFSP